MDEKTEELRDIFIDTTGADTVTESQEESRGSLTDVTADVEARILELVGTMRERYTFTSSLDDEAHAVVVQGYFDDRTDADIASELGVDEETVFEARMDLHLVDEGDQDAPFDLNDLTRLHVEDVPLAERAEHLGVDEATARHYTEVVAADLESTRANDRFRDEFRALLTDVEIEGSLASDAREDGLQEATEDIETDVSF